MAEKIISAKKTWATLSRKSVSVFDSLEFYSKYRDVFIYFFILANALEYLNAEWLVLAIFENI